MKQNKFFYMIVMLLCSVSMMAQEKVLTGTVTELLDNGSTEPIIGANVVLVNNQNRYVKGAVTDIDGNYMLQVPADAKNLKVRATYIGMKAKTVNYTGQTQIDFKLETETVLQEVVNTTPHTAMQIVLHQNLIIFFIVYYFLSLLAYSSLANRRMQSMFKLGVQVLRSASLRALVRVSIGCESLI